LAITYTVKKAAEESGLSMRTLQYAIGRGELGSILVGRRRLIPARSLVEFLFRARKATIAQRKREQ